MAQRYITLGNMVIRKGTPDACLLLVLTAFSGYAQINQDHPELCGKPGGMVIFPRDITATASGSGFELTFNRSRSTEKVKMTSVDEIRQVCPIAGGKLIVFGFLAGYGAYNVDIIDQDTATVLDSFLAYDPNVSPDQHWLVYRRFYPAHSELSLSEEYLMYDLRTDAKGNRSPNPDSGLVEGSGRVIYPVVPDAVAFDNLGLPPDQLHHFRATAFFWAADSRSLIFADETRGTLSIVWVKINADDDAAAFVHPVFGGDVCERAPADQFTAPVTLSNAVVEGNVGLSGLHVEFRSSEASCLPKALLLQPGSFRRGTMEHHPPPVRKKPSVKKKP